MIPKLALHLNENPSVGELAEIYDELQEVENWTELLIEQMEHGKSCISVTWLLKHHLSRGGQLDPVLHGRMLSMLDATEEWEAKLHILQCIPFLAIHAEIVSDLHETIINLTRHTNAFIRAWALSGLHSLSLQYPEYRQDTEERLSRAMTRDSAAVRARIRRIRKLRP